MNPPVRLLTFVAIIACVIILAFILLSAISACFINFANANLARAVSLPNDAPMRLAALDQASPQLLVAQTWSQNPRIDLAFARSWLENKQSQNAVVALQTAGDGLRDDFMAQFVWGNAEWQAGNSGAAFEHWRTAGALEYFVQATRRALSQDQWQSAVELARIVVGIAPNDANVHYLLGDALSHQSPNDIEAMSELARAEQLIGNHDNEFLSTILSRHGEILAAQGKYAQAIDLFNHARQVASLDARPRTDYARAILNVDPASVGEAKKLLEQVVADSPWYTDAYILLADLAEKNGDMLGAEMWYKTGLQKNPNDARLFFPLGEFYVQQNKRDEAQATLTLALKYETRADVLESIARALAQVKSQ